MQGTFSVTFVDLAAYLLPGLIVILPFIILSYPREIAKYIDEPSFISAVILITLAYVIGILVHRLSFIIVYPSYLLNGHGILEGFISSFPEIEKITKSIESLLDKKDISHIDSYLYAQSVVVEKSPKSSLAADRLLYLSILCRNLIVSFSISIFIFSISTILIKLQKFSRSIAYALLIFIPILAILYNAFLTYWQVSVWRVLRAYLMI